ncbi:hypothetical protein BST61_g4051 [Cercospora zeina]
MLRPHLLNSHRASGLGVVVVVVALFTTYTLGTREPRAMKTSPRIAKEAMQFHRAVWNPTKAAEARHRMDQVGDEIERKLKEVLKRQRPRSAGQPLARRIR